MNRCKICGQDSQGSYCSGACKQAAYRGRKVTKPVTSSKVTTKVTSPIPDPKTVQDVVKMSVAEADRLFAHWAEHDKDYLLSMAWLNDQYGLYHYPEKYESLPRVVLDTREAAGQPRQSTI